MFIGPLIRNYTASMCLTAIKSSQDFYDIFFMRYTMVYQ